MVFILFVGGIVIGAGVGWLAWGSHIPELRRDVRRQIALRRTATESREPERLALCRAEDDMVVLQARLDAAAEQIAQAGDEHWELRCRLALAEAASGRERPESSETAARLDALREELADARRASAEEQARHHATESELEAVRIERDTEAGQVADLRAELAVAVAEPDDAPAPNVGRPVAAESRRRIAEVFRAAQSELAPDTGGIDDLTAINGIGPVLGQKLRGLGITTFRQIAALSAADVARVDAVLNFRGRIGRERWIEQAQGILRSH